MSQSGSVDSAAGKARIDKAIAGKIIWLTRPAFQIDNLRQKIEQLDGTVVHLPMFEIKALEYSQPIKNIVLNLDQYDLIFFISTNAAKSALNCFTHFWPQLPAHLQYFAVGPSTAAILEQEGLIVHYPTSAMSSEALLALEELENIEDKKALICRGVGGRETLMQGLKVKGAAVDYLELYERKLPNYSHEFLSSLSNENPPDAIVVTSSEALENLLGCLKQIWPDLLQSTLLVSSERIYNDASEAGFNSIVRMSGATDECIIQSLQSSLQTGL